MYEIGYDFSELNEDELYHHYKTIAESVDFPIMIYNNPGRTGINTSADLIVRLSKIDNIV